MSEALYVWEAHDGEGWYTIGAIGLLDDMALPLLARNARDAEGFREIATTHGRGLNERIRLAVYGLAEVATEIAP